MRIASRVIGIVLAFAGLSFLALSFFSVAAGFDRQSVLVETRPDRTVWTAASFCAVFAIGFILAGWHYLRLDVDALGETQEPPVSRFTRCFLAHRHKLKVIAQVGLVISLAWLGGACFGADWPSRWLSWALVLAGIGLAAIEGLTAKSNVTHHLEWESVPERMRPVLKPMLKAGVTAFLILWLLCLWNAWSVHKISPPIVRAALMVFIFSAEALFFAYGRMRVAEDAA